MTADDPLGALFATLTAEDGRPQVPFCWQMRLLRRLIHGSLPKAVDIPTGLGKTSVMALWLIALAEGAKLPRRLVYVVDRRAVVDQATRFAERLRRNMPAELAARLPLKDNVLPISTLRGGFADNRDWLEDPVSPAIIVGTIDMIGSRLLFEGYGVSRGMRRTTQVFLESMPSFCWMKRTSAHPSRRCCDRSPSTATESSEERRGGSQSLRPFTCCPCPRRDGTLPESRSRSSGWSKGIVRKPQSVNA